MTLNRDSGKVRPRGPNPSPPGAPSATTSIGAPNPRATRSLASSSQSSCDGRLPLRCLSRVRRVQRLASVVEGLIERSRSNVLIRRRTVVKREAMAVRSARLRMVGASEVDLDAREAAHLTGPDEYAAALARAHCSLAVLAELKPSESRALLLQAGGRTYAEIHSATGWTHTKVNRALTEGRAAFHARLAALDAGAACARLAAGLEALASGTALLENRVTLRGHLRACAACRARVRELRSGGLASKVRDAGASSAGGLASKAHDARASSAGGTRHVVSGVIALRRERSRAWAGLAATADGPVGPESGDRTGGSHHDVHAAVAPGSGT
jgi:hypothetical protein